MADYRILLDGMFAAAQCTSAPDLIMRAFVAPPMPCEDRVRASKAPLGLRRIEAMLLRNGFSVADVAVAPPERIADAIGPATRLILVSSGDPLGLGMNTNTMCAIAGGRPYTQVWLERMMAQIKGLRSRFPDFRVLLGGTGAWQLREDDEARRRLGVDLLFCGYAERGLLQVARDLLAGKMPAPVHEAPKASPDDVPGILGPTSMGVVEVSRGCGLGCAFCALRSEPMVHMPIDRIVRDVEVNVRGGVTSASLIGEDLLRYGAEGARLSPEKLIEMIEAVRSVPSLRLIQPDHVSVSSAAQLPTSMLRAIHDAITRGVRHDHVWVNIGMESAGGDLLDANSCRGKMRPFRPEDWEGACEEAVHRLIEAGFIPMVSLVLGLPGETQEHVRRTLAFVERLSGRRAMVFPLFFAPVTQGQRPFGLADMTPLHWRLFRRAYDFNFRWLPKTYWDNQRGAGVSLPKRIAMQAAGGLSALNWKLRFVWKSRRLFA